MVGAPAVGKSTASKAVCAEFAHSLHIPVDDLRDITVALFAVLAMAAALRPIDPR